MPRYQLIVTFDADDEDAAEDAKSEIESMIEFSGDLDMADNISVAGPSEIEEV